MNTLNYTECYLIKIIEEFATYEGDFFELIIMQEFVNTICFLHEINPDYIDQVELKIADNIINNEKYDGNEVSNLVLDGFIKPICMNFLNGRLNKAISLYKSMLEHLTEFYHISQFNLNLFEKKCLDKKTYSDYFYIPFVTRMSMQILNLDNDCPEIKIMEEFLYKLSFEYPENMNKLIENELLIANAISNNRKIKKELMAECLYKGFIKPLCNSYIYGDYDEAKNKYFCMIDYLSNNYKINQEETKFISQEKKDSKVL